MKEITKQTIVLKELYYTGKKINVDKIMKNTNLNLNQVHNALSHLYRRGLIKKSLKNKNKNTGYKNPPLKEINVEINENVIPRIKTLLKKAEDGI